MLKKMVWLVGSVGFGVALSASTLALTEKQHQAIEERVRPVGSACLEGDSNCGSMVAVATGPRTAEDVYKASCHTCHEAGIGGAPKLGDTADWKARLGKGLEQVYSHAINGFNAMPPKGTCMNCSDEEIKETVDFMAKHK
jgi:cytochrome c5